jgi:branched-chain amino acid transport system permease protein
MHFSSTPRSVAQILPAETVSFGGTSFPRDRLWLTLVVSLLGIILWAFFRYTKIGLATRASAENERAISLTGYSPQILAAGTWVISSIAVATIIILGSPSEVLSPLTYTFAIVPALAAALVGRMQSISITVIAGLFLGSFSSVIQNATSKSWWPSWAVTGVTDAVPFLVITVALFAVGKSLPSRGAVQSDPLPEVVRPLNRPWVICTLFILGLIAMSLLSGGYRFGLITSLIVSMIMLSFVVLTGFIGQISLAQASVAGTAGFALSKFATNAGIPFPISTLLASLVAVLCGVIIGIPALRIRGVQLAVVTLAGAVALEKFIFRNPSFSSTSGNMIPDISFLGLDFPVQVGRDVARWSFGVVVLVVLTVLCVLVANLAKSATGRRFLAVRSNERAAASVGINVSLNKLLAFAIASFLAGIGGSFIGYSRGQLSADSFAALVGISFLAFAYLGGITSVSGALVAGASAPLGLIFIFIDRNLNLGSSYGLIG